MILPIVAYGSNVLKVKASPVATSRPQFEKVDCKYVGNHV